MQAYFNFFHFLDKDGLIVTTKIDGYEEGSTNDLPKVGERIKNRYSEEKLFYNIAYALNEKKDAVLFIDCKLTILRIKDQIKMIEKQITEYLNTLYNFNNELLNRPQREDSVVKSLEFIAKKYFIQFDKEFEIEYVKDKLNKKEAINKLKSNINLITAIINMVNIKEEMPERMIKYKTMLIQSLYASFSLLCVYEEIEIKNKNSAVLLLDNKKLDENKAYKKLVEHVDQNLNSNELLDLKNESDFFDSEQFNIQRRLKEFI